MAVESDLRENENDRSTLEFYLSHKTIDVLGMRVNFISGGEILVPGH